MIIGKCKRCGNEMVELDLSEEQRLEIWGLLHQDMKLWAVKNIMETGHYSHWEAKLVVDHFNKEYGKCIRCDFAGLQEENTECPKCKAFNYNLKIESPFNQDFCSHLEYVLNFAGLADETLRGFWCDGISHLPTDMKILSQVRIAADKRIITKAWLGTNGQDKYDMTIHFGEQSLKHYQHTQSLIDCIPVDNPQEWIRINPADKKIEIKLK